MLLHKFSFVMTGAVLCYFAFRNQLKLKSGLNSNGLQILNGFEKRKPFLFFYWPWVKTSPPAQPSLIFIFQCIAKQCPAWLVSAGLGWPNRGSTTLFSYAGLLHQRLPMP
jgi:hypothetical protein